MELPDLLSIRQVAELSGLSVGTIRREIADRALRSKKLMTTIRLALRLPECRILARSKGP